MIYHSIDIKDYDYLNNRYWIEGWCFTDSSKVVDIKVYKNKNELLDVELIRKERPDVQKCHPSVSGALQSGFSIYISNISYVLKTLKNLKIVLSCENENIECFLTKSEILKVFPIKMMEYQLDVQDIHGDKLVLLGWHLDRVDESDIFLEDSKGNRINCEFHRRFREDVIKNMALDDVSYEAGFDFRVLLSDIKTNRVNIVFKNSIVIEKIEIDVKKMCFEKSNRGRAWKTLRPAKWGQNLEYIRKEGIHNFVEYVKQEINPKYTNYHTWIKSKMLNNQQIVEQRRKSEQFVYKPKISIIIPLYNTPIRYLKEMLDSITMQTYSNWELCLVDGSTTNAVGNYIQKKYRNNERIIYKHLGKNMGISENTNAALQLASGEYILLADHDDIVVQGALYEIVSVLNKDSEIDIIYTDEDKISMNGKLLFDPNFKSDFNIDLLRSVNYICHIFVAKKTIVDQIGGFRSAFDGAQDYDFILRCCEKSNRIYHIPKILYHWRAHPNSTAENPESKRYAYDAGKNAVKEHYRRLNMDVEVVDTKYFGIYRSIYKIKDNPLVSILILNKDHKNDLDKCITSIMEKSTYRNFEIIIAENNSTEDDIFSYYDKIQEIYKNVKVVQWAGEFNYSAINNFAAKHARGIYYLLMNNDIEVITPEWLEEMLGYCQRNDVGMVGAKLYYPDKSIQHAGVVLGMGGIAGHILCRADGSEAGYNGRLVTVQDISAVTAACVMIKKSIYEEVNGLDETFKVAFNDIDLCMKVRELGKYIVFTPYAELYHYESKSRGLEDTPEKQLRFSGEIKHFLDKWNHILVKGDPYYNPNLSLEEGDCSLRVDKRKKSIN